MRAGGTMRIEAFDFGTITVDGRTFTDDIKIVRGAVVADWWRIQGHKLQSADIDDILQARPDVLVVGTGDPGMMTVSGEVRRHLADLGIELIEQPTRRACEKFNDLVAAGDPARVAFAAHLTC
jgi:hypothetical protein